MAYDESFEYRGANPYLKAILGDSRWTDGGRFGGDPLEIKVGFSSDGSAGSWQLWEIQAFMTQLEAIEAVINVDFVMAKESDADIVEYKEKAGEIEPLAYHNYPDAWGENEGHYNVEATSGYDGLPMWTTTGLAPGGEAGMTILHEIGHSLGLAHPHDEGADSSIWPGVSYRFNYGTEGSNHQLNTMMSYNPVGWIDSAGNPSDPISTNFGYILGPMAFDIAALQLMYGANTTHNSGDDTYKLPDANAPGTGWMSIWDTGGTDTIAYYGSRDATIDLNAATLQGPKGGGAPSYANGIHGGFTIANKVVIENARGGTGNDEITGNEADNLLEGLGGNDTIRGEGGTDTIFGGDGIDHIMGGDGKGYLYGGRGEDSLHGGSVRDEIHGNEDNDTLYGYAGDDELWGDEGADSYFAGDGNDYIRIDAADTWQGPTSSWLNGGDGYDRAIVDPSSGSVFLTLEDTLVEYVRGSGSGDTLDGSNVDYRLTLNGDGGSDRITGGNHSDVLIGEGGNDIFVASGGKDKIYGGTDDDTYDFSALITATDVNLNTGYATGSEVVVDRLNSIENVIGGSAGDTITGSQVANLLSGGEGSDTIRGEGGDDHIIGGNGDDVLWGGTGGDTFYFDGISGSDTIMDWDKSGDTLVIDGDWTFAAPENFQDISFELDGDNVIIGYQDTLIEVQNAAGYLTEDDMFLV